ncbi:DUF6283 family protein [Thermomonospora umbrina]|uniref:Uncharacterized protein n=1 Tax=Thermomonospora umbrina TaxID=111806 RepID=A0A3D9SX58_9ACTN|nr:DUF6283 family protein [Thermomonospora umbrina]REF00540.1 hypothetical protein DFJ69_6088 [Thermomonospora umbrina]
MRLGPPARRPCATCPYRQDVPSGIWAPEEYQKLRRYDAPTPEQPPAVFRCHQRDRDATGGRVCAGWAGVHDGAHLLALRLAAMNGTLSPEVIDAIIGYVSPCRLFASGAEAADHGMAEIDRPGLRAIEAMSKLCRIRSDLVITDRSHVGKPGDDR